MELASAKPTNNDAFLAISGVGQVKLERYGKQFIDVIVEHGKDSA